MKKIIIWLAVLIFTISCANQELENLTEEITENEQIKNNEMEIITKPINPFTIADQLGYYAYKLDSLGVNRRYVDWGVLCTHQNINKWSKRKPFRDNVIQHNGSYWWRRSGISTNIRSGLYIPNGVDQTWSYSKPTGGINSPYRLGDFRGYDQSAYPTINLQFPNIFGWEQDYEASFIFTGYEKGEVTEEEDTGSVGLQDIFDLQNKYCCIGVKFQSSTQTVIRYSSRIAYSPLAQLFGTNIIIPWGDLIQLVGQGGSIVMEIFLIEADDYVSGQFINPTTWSIRALPELQTRQVNNQYLAIGYVVNTNFHTVQPTKMAGFVYSSGFEQISFSATGRTGGAVNNYSFRARIIGNQIGSGYYYAINNFTLAPNQTQLITIPSFNLQMLDTSGSCFLEYAIYQGEEIVTSITFDLNA